MHAILLSAALLLGADLTAYDNFAVNQSFEKDVNRDATPDGWRDSAFDSPAKLAWDEDVARSGDRSIRISDSHRDGDTTDWKQCTGRWTSDKRPLVSGTEYVLTVWVKTEGVTGDAYAHIAWQRDGRWLDEVGTKRLSGDNDWTQLTVTAVAPENANELVVSMNLARSEGTAWFDDVAISGRSEMPLEIPYEFHDTDDWFEFTFPLDDTNRDSIDLTEFLDAPAGKHGFLTVRDDGHFYFEKNGRRARFFGTNVGGAAAAPPKAFAPILAERLAKYGVNLLRLHAFDSSYGGMIDYSKGNSQSLDVEGLDRMDYFIAELRKRGVYVYMDLLDYRMFRTADGVTGGDEFTHNWAGSMKGASIFDPRMIELQKDYATKLLTHRNPYTGLRYVDDPAIALVETTNENSIFYFIRNGTLSTEHYRDELKKQWNVWLCGCYHAPDSFDHSREYLAEAWGDALLDDEDPTKGTVVFPFGKLGAIRPDRENNDPLAQPARMREAYRFLADVQTRYYRTMREHLKSIGVKAPIAGTNQTFVVADTCVEAAENDIISRNQYWRHPSRDAKPFFKFANEALIAVDIPSQRNPLSVIARTSVEGKPQAVAEFNFPWPNEYRAEGLLMASAYACLQDWDCFLLFSYSPDGRGLSMFRSETDPARWGEFPAAAAMFHRHDVDVARNTVAVVHTPEDAFTPRPDTRYAASTNYRYLTFLSKVRTAFMGDAYRGDADVALLCGPSADASVEGDAKAIRFQEEPWAEWLYPKFVQAAQREGLPGYEAMDPNAKRLRSDTGQLALDYGEGLLTINTPRTKSAIGFLGGRGAFDLDGLLVDCRTPFATVTATSLDGNAIGESRRVLLTCVGRAENTGQGFWPPTPEQMRWSPVQWMLPSEGRSPVIVEPIDADVTLAMPEGAVVYALDPSGKRQSRVAATQADGVLRIDPATAESIWLEVVCP